MLASVFAKEVRVDPQQTSGDATFFSEKLVSLHLGEIAIIDEEKPGTCSEEPVAARDKTLGSVVEMFQQAAAAAAA